MANALPTSWTSPGSLWLVLKGNTLSVSQSATRPAGAQQQIASKGDSLATLEKNIAAALFNTPSNATAPSNLNVPGLGEVPIGTSNPLSTAAGALQDLATGGISGLANSPTGTPGQGLAATVGATGILAAVVRILEGLVGVLFLVLGLHALTGNSSSAGAQVKTVRRYVPVPV